MQEILMGLPYGYKIMTVLFARIWKKLSFVDKSSYTLCDWQKAIL